MTRTSSGNGPDARPETSRASVRVTSPSAMIFAAIDRARASVSAGRGVSLTSAATNLSSAARRTMSALGIASKRNPTPARRRSRIARSIIAGGTKTALVPLRPARPVRPLRCV